jgi:hypothetical protein
MRLAGGFAAAALLAPAPAAAAAPPGNSCPEANGQFARRDHFIGTVAALRGANLYADPGFRLKRPACLHLAARERGSRRIHRTVVSFGMADTCG